MDKEDKEDKLGKIKHRGVRKVRIDDNWNQEALDIIKDIDFNVLIPTINRCYNYDELKEFDLVATCTTGLDHLEIRDIPLISLRGETDFLQEVWATAEHTWALIMALIRKVPWAYQDVCQGNWEREKWQGTELHGKTLGIVGYGRVGQQVARFAEAFGMRIMAYDTAFSVSKSFKASPYFTKKLDGLLRNSDIITVHVPLNDETTGMFGINQFAQMKPTAYFVNTSRGAVVNEDALVNILFHKLIAGAAIDVVENEPHISHNLGSLVKYGKRLIITPHIAGNTAESRKKTQLFIANKIKEYVNGL